MALRDYLKRLAESQKLVTVKKPASKTYEIAGDPEAARATPGAVRAGARVALPRGWATCSAAKPLSPIISASRSREIIPFLSRAIEQRSPCPVVEQAPCQEVVDLRSRPGQPADPAPLRAGRRQLHQLGRGDRQAPASTGRTPISTAACSFPRPRWRCGWCARAISIPSCRT